MPENGMVLWFCLFLFYINLPHKSMVIAKVMEKAQYANFYTKIY